MMYCSNVIFGITLLHGNRRVVHLDRTRRADMMRRGYNNEQIMNHESPLNIMRHRKKMNKLLVVSARPQKCAGR
jgi:hypothetical protein